MPDHNHDDTNDITGPYSQCWDWDSVFLGTATLNYGGGQ